MEINYLKYNEYTKTKRQRKIELYINMLERDLRQLEQQLECLNIAEKKEKKEGVEHTSEAILVHRERIERIITKLEDEKDTLVEQKQCLQEDIQQILTKIVQLTT